MEVKAELESTNKAYRSQTVVIRDPANPNQVHTITAFERRTDTEEGKNWKPHPGFVEHVFVFSDGSIRKLYVHPDSLAEYRKAEPAVTKKLEALTSAKPTTAALFGGSSSFINEKQVTAMSSIIEHRRLPNGDFSQTDALAEFKSKFPGTSDLMAEIYLRKAMEGSTHARPEKSAA